MSHIHSVPIATDFSERSARAEVRAAMLCAELGCANVELLAVKGAGMPAVLAGIMNGTAESARMLTTEQTERELQARSGGLENNHGIHCAHSVRFGRAATEIVARADEIAADLTVSGHMAGTFSLIFFSAIWLLN